MLKMIMKNLRLELAAALPHVSYTRIPGGSEEVAEKLAEFGNQFKDYDRVATELPRALVQCPETTPVKQSRPASQQQANRQ